ncbi:MAG: sortase [Anaerolineaceae bacterium]
MKTNFLLVLGIFLMVGGSIGAFNVFDKGPAIPTGSNPDEVVVSAGAPISSDLSYADIAQISNPEQFVSKETAKVISEPGAGFLPLQLEAVQTVDVEEDGQKYKPTRIVIPTIELDAPIVEALSQQIKVNDKVFDQWLAPNDFAAGWQTNSATLGKKGNSVINGHHNIDGKVFEKLVDLNEGETIQLFSGDKEFDYVITNKMILKELNVDLETRLNNATWLMPSNDERITLVTCWPSYSNTHRLIIVAVPANNNP